MIDSCPATALPSSEADLAELVVRLEQQLKQCQEDLDVCAAQIGTDYEQLAFLRTLAEYLDMSEASHGTWHVAKTLLPLLASVVQAESLVLVAAAHEKENASESCVDGPVTWVGPVRLSTDACRRFVERHRSAAVGQPVINNHLAGTAEGNEFPGVHKFLMVSVAKGSRSFGWLIAINHAHQQRPAHDNPLWELSQFEFGSVEAGVLSAVASMLATHAHNVELFREKEGLLIGIVRAMVSAIDAKDPYTCGHSERVALVARFLGRKLELDESDCERIYLAGLLHDLGKLGVPDAILGKPGPLSEAETEEIRVHPERGWAILQDLDPLKHLVPGILCHHEHYDGTGYPDGLAGEAIPLIARVLAAADSYDAMVSDRPYRRGMPHAKVERVLRDGSGTQWDPKVIDALLGNLPAIKALWNAHRPQTPRRRERAAVEKASP
jgi:HD-GYP domain-containing protein (c-di-GMP phosphodiesterase class II)